jgi:hypothetical protein
VIPVASRVWNDARDALLRELVASGKSRSECIAPLNALAGAPVTKQQQVAHRMYTLRLTLTGERRRASWTAALMTHREVTYTPERLAYLREAYPAGTAVRDIMTTLNAMPGPQVKSLDALTAFANKIGLKRPPRKFDAGAHKARHAEHKRVARALAAASKPAPQERAPIMAKRAKIPVMREGIEQTFEGVQAAVIEPSPEIADAVTEARYAKVRAALSKRNADAAALARVHGMPLREVYRLVGEVRREMRA